MSGSYLSDLHMHTFYSDGKASPEEMVLAAVRLGLKRIAITDHAGGHIFYGVRAGKLVELRKEVTRQTT